MRKIPMICLAGLTAIAFAGAAVAADLQARTMKVPLADGSTLAIEYVGDVAPKVKVLPANPARPRHSRWMFPGWAGFHSLFADMNRRHAELIRHIETLKSQSLSASPGLNLASAGNAPPGATSVSVVSVSSGGKTCTRTTEVVSQGPGKPPKVTTNVSGECGPETPGGANPAGAPGPTT